MVLFAVLLLLFFVEYQLKYFLFHLIKKKLRRTKGKELVLHFLNRIITVFNLSCDIIFFVTKVILIKESLHSTRICQILIQFTKNQK